MARKVSNHEPSKTLLPHDPEPRAPLPPLPDPENPNPCSHCHKAPAYSPSGNPLGLRWENTRRQVKYPLNVSSKALFRSSCRSCSRGHSMCEACTRSCIVVAKSDRSKGLYKRQNAVLYCAECDGRHTVLSNEEILAVLQGNFGRKVRVLISLRYKLRR